MKQIVKNALCALYKYSGLMCAQEGLARGLGQSFMSVLLFHRVTDEIPEDGLTVSTRWFRGFCKLMQRRFHVVPLARIFRLLETGEKPPRRTVAITFDDCYQDNLWAARTLSEHGLPACFFLPTDYVETEHVFFWDQGLPRLANLSWNEVREIASLGHEIGSHTASHPDLGKASAEEFTREIRQSRRVLEEKLGKRVRWLAYPFGGKENFRLEHLPLLFEAGYEGCLSGYGGFLHKGQTYPLVPREAVPPFRNLTNLELHLAGCLNWMYGLKRGLGMLAVQKSGPSSLEVNPNPLLR